jgi:hypothetical protein
MPRVKKSAALAAEQEKFFETLKFTPCTYKISLWGYGGETVMGTVDRDIYDYFRHRRLAVSDFAWDSDYAEENNIPEDMWPFPPGSWYECDDIAHGNGVERNSGTLHIEDETGEIVYQKSLDDISGYEDSDGNPEPEWCNNNEAFIDEKPPGTIVFIGTSNEKGTFFEGEIDLTAPFDVSKLTLNYDEIDGSEIIAGVSYDDVDIDNWGGSTDGKSSEFGFYVAGSLKDGKWERYRDADDCVYKMTEWIPSKIDPIRDGIYEIQGGDKKKWPFTDTTTARWTGSRWISVWAQDTPAAEEVKIKQWRGIAHDPDEKPYLNLGE